MKRVVRYDLLRIAACFAIVLLHVSNSYWYTVDVNSQDFVTMTIYNSLTRFGVPVFFMLSGLFLLDPEREFQGGKWGKKLLRLAVGFFLWSLFYAFQSILFHGFFHGWGSVTREMWWDGVVRLLRGHGHMWFLWDLFGFYLLLPILRKVCEDIKVLGYFLLLWVIVRFVVVTILPGVGGGMFLATVTNMHLYMLTGYIGYFLGGYYLSRVTIPRWGRGLVYGAGMGALVFTMVKTIADCRTTLSYDDHWFLPSNTNVLLLSIAMFIFFQYRKLPGRIENGKWVPAMAKCTFFVYMIHPFFIEKLNLLGIKVIAYPVVVSIPVMTIGIFAVAMMLGWAVGKIPVVGKWVTIQ